MGCIPGNPGGFGIFARSSIAQRYVELEGLLLAHPGVKDCAVGIKSRKWDERPVAVLGDDDGPVSLDSVHAFLADKVAKWWLPNEVVCVDEIPKTGVGKIDKKVIRQQLAHIELD